MTTNTLTENLISIDQAAADTLFYSARTVNRFDGEPVVSEQLQAAYDMLRWGPTAWNLSPLRLVSVKTAENRERLAQHLMESNQEKTLAAPATIIAAYDPNLAAVAPTMAPAMDGLADLLNSLGEEFQANNARNNAMLQIGYLIVALRAVGLDAGPMTGFNAAGVDDEFFAESGWKSLVVINVGKPAAENASYPRGPRFEFEQVSVEI